MDSTILKEFFGKYSKLKLIVSNQTGFTENYLDFADLHHELLKT